MTPSPSLTIAEIEAALMETPRDAALVTVAWVIERLRAAVTRRETRPDPTEPI